VSPWIRDEAKPEHTCPLPLLWLRKPGRRWQCPTCRTVWIIETYAAFGGDGGRMWISEQRALELGLVPAPNRKGS
jgi:hypothetical protein